MELKKNNTGEKRRGKRIVHSTGCWGRETEKKEKSQTWRRNVRSSEEERDEKGYCAAIATAATTLFHSVDRNVHAKPVSLLHGSEESSTVAIGDGFVKLVEVHRCAAC